ncbi:carbohydrate kinase family protein [Microbacterium sp. ASV49]|uniref:Carbohydrate kinase family protein n=1 Tax=Microbacterium candidum TaxID=3041922 RepID=A0ABT7MVJ3_9MICO|nr:carbohydrate kinase family protein [Microbacterium sp. ASV49]MDL9978433.1 carbohydrate kinase family protein [Microbacterium sp. ASV49]
MSGGEPAPTVVTIGPSGVDHYYEADAWPALGGKGLLRSHSTTYGGMIANTACVLARLGAHTIHLERIGADGAEGVLASLQDHGVDTSLVQVSRTARTCVCQVVRVGGERSILIDDDGRETIAPDERLRPTLEQASAIVTSLAELRQPLIRSLVLGAVARGARLAIDVEPAGIGDAELDAGSIAAARWVITNAEALDAVGQVPGELASGREVIVVDGARGSTVFEGDRIDVVPALRVDVVDTTGCSDTYLAAYVFSRLRGDEPITAARFATAAAGRAATLLGPRSGAVSAAEIESFVAGSRGERDTDGPVGRQHVENGRIG